MTQDINGLLPGTTYFYRAVIRSNYGTSYGLTYSFRTTGTAPYVEPAVTNTSGTISAVTHKAIATVKKPAAVKKPETANVNNNLAAAGAVDTGFLGLSFKDWMMILAHIFFMLGMYFFFLFFCCGRKREEEEETWQEVAPFVPAVIPLEREEKTVAVPQKTAMMITQKGIPPMNLPV
jgi:hypothetical protein